MFETQFTKVNIPRSTGFILWSTLCVCVIWKPTTQSATYIFTKEKWLVESSLAKTFVTRVLCPFWNRTFVWSLCECVYWASIFSIITHTSFTIDIFSWLSISVSLLSTRHRSTTQLFCGSSGSCMSSLYSGGGAEIMEPLFTFMYMSSFFRFQAPFENFLLLCVSSGFCPFDVVTNKTKYEIKENGWRRGR